MAALIGKIRIAEPCEPNPREIQRSAWSTLDTTSIGNKHVHHNLPRPKGIAFTAGLCPCDSIVAVNHPGHVLPHKNFSNASVVSFGFSSSIQ
jgi:hypothetical protein